MIATARAYVSFAEANPAHFRIMFRIDLIDVQADPAPLSVVRAFTELTNVVLRQMGQPEITLGGITDENPPH